MNSHEETILDVILRDPIIAYEGYEYELAIAGKPVCAYGAGDPKTDIYALYRGIDTDDELEFKISAKMTNFSFLQNHITALQAEYIIGKNWSMLLEKAAHDAFPDVNEVPLCYLEGMGKTKPFSLTLGWRVDLTADGGKRAVPLIDDDLGKLIVLSGQDYEGNSYLTDDQTNPLVNGQRISYGGVADYMLVDLDNPVSADEVIDHLIPIEDYAHQMGDIYANFKAVNERLLDGKHDQDRALGVYVDWFVNDDGLLDAKLDFQEPLLSGADSSAAQLADAMNDCSIYSVNDLIPGVTVEADLCYGAAGEHIGTAGNIPYQPRLF